MVHVNRTLAEFDAVGRSARQNGTGHAGEIRLGVRMPPVGEPLGSLLAGWRVRHPNVLLTIVELNEPSMAMALETPSSGRGHRHQFYAVRQFRSIASLSGASDGRAASLTTRWRSAIRSTGTISATRRS